MKIYDLTDQLQRAWEHYDKLLEDKIDHIAELSGVEKSRLIKLNPAEFVEKSKGLYLRNYKYQNIGEWVTKAKTPNNFLISPVDKDEETANQISYKSGNAERKIRAHKCKILPIPSVVAKRFFVKNHRQSIPNTSTDAISYALVYEGEIVAVMTYDFTAGAVRGLSKADQYELLRLSLKANAQVNGGASKLQKKCEESIMHYGCNLIFSYSNATINEGKVYQQLGFTPTKILGGQAWTIERDMQLRRLVEGCKSGGGGAKNTDLLRRGALKTHITANRTWTKRLDATTDFEGNDKN